MRHTLRTRSWDAATGVAETNFFVSETCRLAALLYLGQLAAFGRILGSSDTPKRMARAERKPAFVAALGLWLSWGAFFVSETCRVGRAVVSGPACRICRIFGSSDTPKGWWRAERKPVFVAALGLWLSWGAFFVSETCRVGRAVVSGPACRICRIFGSSDTPKGWWRAERKPVFVAALGLWLSWDAFFVSETGPIGPTSVSGA